MSLILVLEPLFLEITTADLTTFLSISSTGEIADLQQAYTNIIYQQDSVCYAKNRNGTIVKSSTDFSVVWKYTISSSESTLIMNGIYYPQSVITTDIVSNVSVIGESKSGCIIDLSRMPELVSYGSSWIPSGQYAGIVIRGTNLNIQSLTFHNYSLPVLGLGEYDSNMPSQNNFIQNIQFRNCTGGDIYFYDGSGSTVNNIKSDSAYGAVYFWNGDQSNIKVSNIYMEPTLAMAPYGCDSTISFLPQQGNTSNIVIDNVVGNYTAYFDEGGTDFHMAGVVDFASYTPDNTNSVGNVTWNNLTVSNIYGYYAPALSVAFNFTGLTNSVFENLHSSYSQGGLNIAPMSGVYIEPRLFNANLTINNVLFKDIYVDHANGAGFNFLVSGTGSPSVRAIVQGVTLENLYLTDNNQQKGTNSSSATVLYYGISGLNIGNLGAGINIFYDLTIDNLQATDEQALPTQQYPITWWNIGAAGSSFTNIQIIGGYFAGNVYDMPTTITPNGWGPFWGAPTISYS